MKKQKKILIIEDDVFLSKMLARSLESSDFSVLMATSGRDGLNKINKNGFDLVLLDIMLPDIDGFEVLEQIRLNDKTKNVPVVIMSNLGQPEDIKQAKKLGVEDYVIKSDLSLEDVGKKIKKILKEKI